MIVPNKSIYGIELLNMIDKTENISDQKLSEQHYTKPIQAFIADMANWSWDSQMPSALFIRDYANLPEKSPHDIDMMIDAEEQGIFLDHVAERASAFDLHYSIRRQKNVCFALVFDLDVSRPGRAWAFLEVRESIQISPSVALQTNKIAKEFDKKTGLPIPEKSWIAFLEMFQGLRANKLERAKETLANLGIEPNGFAEHFSSLTGNQIKHPLDFSEDGDDVSNLRDLIVLKKEKPDTPESLPYKTRLNRMIFKNAYYIHHAKPLLFTIHGPDGVGKSTTCREVEKIFARLPLPLCSHHHITGWKYPKPEALNTDASEIAESNKKARADWQPGSLHLFLRWGYRKMPQSLQSGYVLAQGYNKYLTNLNKLVFKEYCRGNITFIDRYIYDLATKNVIKKLGWQWVSTLFTRLARLPIRTYVLTDTDENIYSRKQELSLDEIRRYKTIMASVMKRRGASKKTIDLAGKSPETVAQIISKDILISCDLQLREIMSAAKN